jgi:hypothetical protein
MRQGSMRPSGGSPVEGGLGGAQDLQDAVPKGGVAVGRPAGAGPLTWVTWVAWAAWVAWAEWVAWVTWLGVEAEGDVNSTSTGAVQERNGAERAEFRVGLRGVY